MKLKALGNAEEIIEKFCAQSNKTAKYAKSLIRKRESSQNVSDRLTAPSNMDTTSVGGNGNITVTS